jgi:hypothetical protein
MQEDDDELVDYNEDLSASRTPVQTPLNLNSDDEGEEEEDKRQEEAAKRVLEEGRKADEDNLARRVKHLQEFETLSNRLSENGYRMRMKVWSDPTQAFRPMSMTAPTKSLAEIPQSIPLEDAAQVSEFQGLVYMPEQFLEKYLLPTMQIRKLLETESELNRGDQPLPGGPETAIMYALYHQVRTTNDTKLDSKLRSLFVTQTFTDLPKQVKDITENRLAKDKSLEYLISSVLTNFEQQLKRDYKAFERERHQNVLIANLNYEQQLHIIDANKQHLELSNQREQIVQEAVGLDIQLKVSTTKDSLKSLQEEMVLQCRDLSSILGPMNTTHLMETLKRMKDALQDATYQNAYLHMHNNELTLENSYMTPVQRSTIARIKTEGSRYYTQQRVTPHYIEAYPQGTVMFQPHDNLQIPCAPYVRSRCNSTKPRT